MMTKKYILILLTGFSILSGNMAAQDFHLAQYDAFSQYLNPALTGNYPGEEGDYRIYANYRSQWKSIIAKPFSTMALGYDMPYKKFGIGGYLVDNRSGTGQFGTLNFLASGAYRISGSDGGPHHLSTGLQLGIFYKSFNSSKYTFDSQYSSAAGGFDTSLDDEESFDKTGIVRFDANIGVFYKFIPEGKKAHPFLGFSIFHLTRPDESFTSEASKLPMRFNAHLGCDININDRIDVTPNLLYMNQAAATELNFGAMGSYKTNDGGPEVYRILLGLNYRTNDAFIAQAGLKNENHIFRIGYDFNTSPLRQISGGRGGIEFSLILTGFKGKPIFTKGMF